MSKEDKGLLVLTRHENDEIVIGDPPIAVVRVCEIKGARVRIGIKCDKNIPVVRAELLQKKDPRNV